MKHALAQLESSHLEKRRLNVIRLDPKFASAETGARVYG